jgi:hypothetical protein
MKIKISIYQYLSKNVKFRNLDPFIPLFKLMVQKNVFAILFRKGALIPKFCIIERYKEFLFFIQFQCFFLNGLWWELSEVLRQISSFFYCFRDKIDQKMLKKSQFPKFEEKKISHPILMQFSCEVFILIGYLWTIKQIC